jgi:4-amino-4-deoxy-L-arabinose transferase-like glycosyltransferase
LSGPSSKIDNPLLIWKVCIPFIAAYCILTFLVKDHIFFWDTVQLASRHAHWYYENNFQYFFLPESLDSGHPPFFGMGLALAWKLLGKSLWVSHFYILFFLIGNVVLCYRLANYFFDGKKTPWLLILILVDPFLAAQSTLVSPDIILVFFWLLSILGVIQKKPAILLLAAIGLAALSMRGMMLVFAVFLFYVYRQYYAREKGMSPAKLIHAVWPFIPSGLLALIFLYAHYQHAGWIGYHENSPWAPSFEPVSFSDFIKNIGLLGWRLLDFGRVFIWCFIIGLLVYGFWKKIKFSTKLKELLALVIILILITTPSSLLHKSLMAHRYFLPIVLSLTFLGTGLVLHYIKNKSRQNLVLAIMVIGLLTGNYWVYPKDVAQGWDSTLAHLPYYDLREKMIDYIEEKNIPFEQIGTAFPNIASLEILELNGDVRSFSKKDLNKNEYIFYSNVYNDFSDEELILLENHWEIEEEMWKGQVCVILYRRL